MKNINETLGQRGEVYGEFKDNAVIAQELKSVIYEWDQGLSLSQREALEVIMQKISRILTGDADYQDNWHDIAGYATLIERELHSSRTGEGI